MVVISYNSIYAVLFLILTYISASSMLLIFKCEFFALIFITIYVGAVAVLFLFVILMIDIKLQSLNNRIFSYSYSIFLSGFFFIELLILIFRSFRRNPYYNINFQLANDFKNWILKLDMLLDLEVLGQVLSINFVLQLLIAGLILFLGIIGSVVLTLNFKSQKTKPQIFYRQLSKNFRNSLVH
jgi:NADH-quinone oxidoreductase subunit J